MTFITPPPNFRQGLLVLLQLAFAYGACGIFFLTRRAGNQTGKPTPSAADLGSDRVGESVDPLFELELKVARRADEIAQNKPQTAPGLHSWLLAELEIMGPLIPDPSERTDEPMDETSPPLHSTQDDRRTG